MKSYLIGFLAFSILMTGCGYSFETDETLEVYLDVVKKMRFNNDVLSHELFSLTHQIKHDTKRKIYGKPLREATIAIHEITKEFDSFLDEIHEQFYDFVEDEEDPFLKNTKKLDKHKLRNQRPANEFFITGYYDKNKKFIEPKGQKIKDKLAGTHNKIIHILDTLSNHKFFRIKDDEKAMLVSKWIIPKPELLLSKNKWIETTFGGKSVAASFTNLALLENDALLTTQMTLRYLGAKIGGCGPLFDRFVVVSSPLKNYVKPGETFKADIFLSAASSQSDFTAKINGKIYPIENGVIEYETKPNKYGTHTYKAEITIKNPHTKKVETFTKTFQYEVGECYH